jgi:magnesium transporter
MAAGRRKKNTQRKHGLSPGTLVFTGTRHASDTEIQLVQYGEDGLAEKAMKDAIPEAAPDYPVTWYDIRGLHHVDLIEALGQRHRVHALALEDVLDIQQRPKFEDYEDSIFIIAQALTFDDETKEINYEQIAIFARDGLVLSFQEKPDDTFRSVRERLQNATGRIRKRGADYLVYALLDTIVDHYYLVLDKVEEMIELQEDEVLNRPREESKGNIHRLKIQVISLRKAIAPLREAINAFSRSDNPFVRDQTRLYIRDIYDHTIQIIDAVETWRDVLNGLFDLYLSQLSYRMNNVIQVLTIISTIFIPLTFLAGVYGMNFTYMPELQWRYGYAMLWGLMLLIAAWLLWLFRRKNWL